MLFQLNNYASEDLKLENCWQINLVAIDFKIWPSFEFGFRIWLDALISISEV